MPSFPSSLLRLSLPTAVLCLFLVGALSSPASGGALNDAVLGLHVQPRVSKNLCLPANQGGEAPNQTPCSQYITTGQLGTNYNVYLVAAQGLNSSSLTPDGFTGISCGLDYDAAVSQGVDVFGWTACSDLDFPTAGANGEWPEAGGSNRITWVSCQSSPVSGFASEGPVAIAGSFYVYAYGEDQLRITTNNNVQAGPELVVADCDGAETQLTTDVAAFANFDAAGIPGCNPCLGPCDPVPDCRLEPGSLVFVGVPVNGFEDQTVVIGNAGTTTISGTLVSPCGDFTVVQGANYSIAPGTTHNAVIRFSPTLAGDQACVISTGSGCPSISLSGSTVGTCEATPNAIDFGELVLGVTSSPVFYQIVNNGPNTLTGNVSLSCSQFQIVSGAGSYSLAPGEAHAVQVTFTPSSVGAHVCSIANDPCESVTATGTGLLASGDCQVSKQTLLFDNVPLGSIRVNTFTITNHGTAPINGVVSENCDDYEITLGAGPYTLNPNDMFNVQVTFAPTVLGTQFCTISTGTECSDVVCEGSTPPPCDVSPSALAFGDVTFGETSLPQSFVITNVGPLPLSGNVPVVCGAFQTAAGSGAYSLDPGETHTVDVVYTPTTFGLQTCELQLGTPCGSVSLSGTGLGAPSCSTNTNALDFGSVFLGFNETRSFQIVNTSPVSINVNLPIACGSAFSVVTPSPLTVPGNSSRSVTVRFTPPTSGNFFCALLVNDCGDFVQLSGSGTADTGPLDDARLAVHIKPFTTKSICVPAESGGDAPTDIPCFQYEPQGDTFIGYNMYLVAITGDFGRGIAGASFGIEYGPRLQTFGWELCADLEFSGGGWPSSGGGNLVTWNASTNCQIQRIPGFEFEGVHAIIGALYVYAYGDETFTYTQRQYVPNPDMKLASCTGAETNVPQGPLAGFAMARFFPGGTASGYNPCGLATPVKLLSFTAARVTTGAELLWSAEFDGAYSAFQVYRETDDGTREPVSTLIPVSGSDYAWIDEAPPVGETIYHLAALTRDGTREWAGSVTLPAGAAFGTRLALLSLRPNPFRSATVFRFRAPENGEATLQIFSTDGREVARPLDRFVTAGDHEVSWDGRDAGGAPLGAGVYFFRLRARDETMSGKVVLIR